MQANKSLMRCTLRYIQRYFGVTECLLLPIADLFKVKKTRPSPSLAFRLNTTFRLSNAPRTEHACTWTLSDIYRPLALTILRLFELRLKTTAGKVPHTYADKTTADGFN